MNKPEIKKLEMLVADYDYMLQEGVLYTGEEIARISFLIEELQKIVNDLNVR